jgi:hypothetical protein
MAEHVMTLSMDMNVNVLLDITASTVTMVSISGSLENKLAYIL